MTNIGTKLESLSGIQELLQVLFRCRINSMTTSGHNWLPGTTTDERNWPFGEQFSYYSQIRNASKYMSKRLRKTKEKKKRTERNGIWRQELETIPTKTHKKTAKRNKTKEGAKNNFKNPITKNKTFNEPRLYMLIHWKKWTKQFWKVVTNA